ncbi:hypothetical protein EGW08_022607 [Elysia chlorotica]|uniref:Dipeptidyl peptidase 9 n=1 Tax=Elysia chlorotica TaxID=188477 RepID=A0A433SKF9_ELYCH|nr:hypothetical protein EGW08_022607 [Elysia chlorotica]
MASEDFDTYALPTASPPRPQTGCKKSWIKLRMTVRETRKNITRLTSTTPSNFQFRSVVDEQGRQKTRLYFLGDMDKSRESTLLKVDIPDEPLQTLLNVEGEECSDEFMESEDANYLDPVSGERQPQKEPVYPMIPVFTSHPTPSRGSAPMSKEEQLLRERKRLGTYGITSYEISPEHGLFIIPAHNGLYRCYDKPDFACVPVEIPTRAIGARLDPKICPSNPDLLTFINDSDIWLTCLESGREIRLTHASRGMFGDSRVEDNPVSNGVPSFVIQEEFDRYTGYWWSPQCQHRGDGKQVYHILYEEVDESEVGIVSIFSPSNTESTESYRYPRAGTNNASSSLRLLELTVTNTGHVNVQVADYSMRWALFEACPWAEYLTRAGWTADGKYIYAMLLDRLQQRQAVMLISPSSFFDFEGKGSSVPHMQCIYEEVSDIWINVNDILYFFPQSSEDSISFLCASEKSGFRHLYLMTSEIHTSGQGTTGQQIGQGDGAGSCNPLFLILQGVLPSQVWVDESRGLVFFMGMKDSPLESHLYVTSYRNPGSPVCLTEPGFSHTVQLSKDFSQFVTVYSSLDSPPQSAVFKLTYDSEEYASCVHLGHLTRKPVSIDYKPPVLFQYPSRAGHTAYGLYFPPHGLEQGKRYPTVLFVYGGPCVQMVTNSFKGQKFLRLHTLAADGYAVVVIDGRGSTNRGLNFEGILKNQLGTVEVEDQVEGLLWLASQVQFIDMSRVAIYGWSYGGYMSLMGLAQRPDIFKVAIAGAPVVSWELYDSGYTERYIGLPLSNPDVYKAGSVLTYIESLPDDETRLLLIHSLKDENVHFHHSSALINQLVRCCKPYQLQTYPNERHGIRDNEANEHYKTTVLKFLQDYL